MRMRNVTFLVDGFNLYHSIEHVGRYANNGCYKWLDLWSLCASYLSSFRGNSQIKEVYYFTAFATHLSRPDTVFRHKSYIKCLTDTGVTPIYGRFKRKDITCSICHRKFVRHEEKETDVSIAVKLMELLCSNSPNNSYDCDVIVIISGDTDIAPAVRTALKIVPNADIWFAFPPGRKNRELADITGKSIDIKGKALAQHQLPNPYILSNGVVINKPTEWE